jgi:type I restriction enzyme S subunit
MTLGPYKVPEGWRWIRLGEACEYERRTIDPSRFPHHEFLVYSIPAYDNNKQPEVLKGSAIGSAKLVIQPNVCLFSKLNPRIPRAWVIKKDTVNSENPLLASTEFMPLRPRPEMLDVDYLGMLLLTSTFLDQVRTDVTGATGSRQRLKPEIVLDAFIPLPPLSEQRRIVARIEELMDRVREARRLRQEAQKDAERLWQSVLAQTFPRPGSDLPEGWRWVRLGEVCETKMGGTPSTKVREYWEPPEIVWVTPEDMERQELNRITSSRRQISVVGLEKSSAKLFPAGAVLLSTTATIGKVGIAEIPLSANQQISGIICSENINHEFIAYYLLSVGEDGLRKFGGTATATHINQTNLKSLPIPLPPLSEQRRIVAHLEAVQERLKALKEAQAATEAELKRLEQAILEKAFRGEL